MFNAIHSTAPQVEIAKILPITLILIQDASSNHGCIDVPADFALPRQQANDQ